VLIDTWCATVYDGQTKLRKIPPVWRIPEKRLRSDLASVSVTGADNRDIVDSVDRDAPVVRDRNDSRPDIPILKEAKAEYAKLQ
jgi:hypothetical protein